MFQDDINAELGILMDRQSNLEEKMLSLHRTLWVMDYVAVKSLAQWHILILYLSISHSNSVCRTCFTTHVFHL